jgi:hypothetical protein
MPSSADHNVPIRILQIRECFKTSINPNPPCGELNHPAGAPIAIAVTRQGLFASLSQGDRQAFSASRWKTVKFDKSREQ